MLSNGSHGTLMSYTDHSAQRRLKSNVPIVLNLIEAFRRGFIFMFLLFFKQREQICVLTIGVMPKSHLLLVL